MNAQVRVDVDDAEHKHLASVLRDALVSLEHGDCKSAERAAHALDQWFAMPVHRSLMKIQNDMRQALGSLPFDEHVSKLAGHDLPDAASRLDHIVGLTEQAAHRTLELSEEMRRHVDQLAVDGASRETIETMRRLLSELFQSQTYQDLTGQVIRSAVGVVQRAEKALREAMAAVGIEVAAAEAPRSNDAQVLGGIDKHASSQGDADDLLDSLGI